MPCTPGAGVDATHRDLMEAIACMRDFTGSPFDVSDLQAHGTHAAGIIGARENDHGMVGVCPDIGSDGGGLIIGKVLGDDGTGRASWVSAGLAWAVDQGAQVVSMSLGSPVPDRMIFAAIAKAVAGGVHVVAAAGNDGSRTGDRVNYPARYRETIAVGAVGRDRVITDFSSRGKAVDVVAPGESILSTVPGDRYMRMSGTSMAAPFVAGVIGLICAEGWKGNVEQLRRLLYNSAEDAGAPGRDDTYGAGLIRPDRMITAIPEESAPSASDGLLIWIPGAELR